MAILEILTIPDTRLKHKSVIVENFDKSLDKIIKDMFDLTICFWKWNRFSSASVGIKKRIVVVDIKKDDVSDPVAFVNPRIKKFSDERFINEEGCLSVPEYYANVERAKEVEVEWFDNKGLKKSSIFLD